VFERATRWRPGVDGTDFSGIGDATTGPSTVANGLNVLGTAVGYTNRSDYDHLPLRWNPDGTVDTLAVLTAGLEGFAYAINDRGDIVGCTWSDVYSLHAVLWLPDSVPRDLGTLGGPSSCAFGISNSRVIVGDADVAPGDRHAFRWTESTGMVDLGTLGGPTSTAWGVNNRGDVVGESDLTTHGTPHAFLWTSEHMMVQLPLLPGGGVSAAYAINDSGDVVGYSENPYGHRATLWRRLHPLPISLSDTAFPGVVKRLYSQAHAISSSGLIAGFLFNQSTGSSNAVFWRVTHP